MLICSSYSSLLAKTAAAATVAAKVEAKVQAKVQTKVEAKVKITGQLNLESASKMETAQDLASRLSALEAKVDALTRGNVQSSLPLHSDGTNLRNYMYKEAMIFDDVFNALNSNVIEKLGNPAGWDETSYASNPWNNKRILRIGGGVNSGANGIKVNIPEGYNVLWLRVLNDRWTTFRVWPHTQTNVAQFGTNFNEVYATGYRNLNEISPDGAAPNSHWNVHKWIPIPIRNNAQAYNVATDRESDGWISGIAFGKNLWNHAMNSAVAYHWKVNPGVGDVTWNTHNWNNDQLAMFVENSNAEVSVPVIYTGKDKVIYIIEHNNNWTGTQHGEVYVNGVKVDRFRTSFQNPFSVHFNSKFYDRYMATTVPANLIQPGDKFLRLKIDMTESNNRIHFREIGTHDYI